METTEVLVVGGGPAGSTCAAQLRQAGLDVQLMDSHRFPRHKPCAGWITPEVCELLDLDLTDYRSGRVLQEIRGFQTGLIDGALTETHYGSIVSYGILRSEFDHYLLQRSGVRLILGESMTSMERSAGYWIVNGHIRARIVVGAGGHFCPVARHLGASIGHEEVVAAQVAEFALGLQESNECTLKPGIPALLFCRDMKGYGWVFRKGNYINVGLGRLDNRDVGRYAREFCTLLKRKGFLPERSSVQLRGHAYRLFQISGGRRLVDDGVLLIGDSAGVAHAPSGEGILPSIKTGCMAADAIVSAHGDYRREKLASYSARLASHFGNGNGNYSDKTAFPGIKRIFIAHLFYSRYFTRNVVLDRWFLHAGR